MGIPSYFFQLMKRHKHVVTKYTKTHVDNLYLDSNSIIYDVVQSLDKNINKHEFETTIIQQVCIKLLSYLELVQPSRVFIAFDGVPPMAKIKQQRERRYKSWVTAQWLNETKPWDTVQITPGTPFMKRLDKELITFFEPYRNKYQEFYLSTSNDIGEGEHKLFTFIRSNPNHIHQTTMIYGLDSDLIILSLNHLSYCKEIKLLREASAFMVHDTHLHILDVNELSTCITNVMGKDKLMDYIFITLLLGNDFMPHFPALNLRTTGLDTILTTYAECMKDKVLFDGTIQWDNVKEFITALAQKEEQLFIREHEFRNNRKVDDSTHEKRIHNLPMLKREKEYNICPTIPNWQSRYYSYLLPNTKIEDICINYSQMLEWNIRYYTTGCFNWSMYYQHPYPPLLEDLAKYLPEHQELQENNTHMTSNELLAFVLPNALLYYMDEPCPKKKEPTIVWSYCTYMWESHIKYEL
jgi:5'-3' exonuclease